MRRYFHIIMLSLLCLCPLFARALDTGSSSVDDNSMYAEIYRNYKNNISILKSSVPNSSAYIQAKRALKEIYPSLQKGAVYNSGHGYQQNALLFAQAFIDLPLMKEFEGESFIRDEYFPTIAYFAASGTYNTGNYERAIKYFKVYLSTNDQKNRKNVYMFMAKACINVKDYELAIKTLNDACNYYPDDYQLLSVAINSCIECDDKQNLQTFVDKAIVINPNDMTLLNIQAKLYEDTMQYQKALNVYNQMLRANPNSLTITRHVAINNFNLGVLNYNKASSGSVGNYSRQANDYFRTAAGVLESIVANDPSSVKYTRALAIAYSCIGDDAKLEYANDKLNRLGGGTVSSDAVPSLISYSSDSQVSGNAIASSSSLSSTSASEDIPLYSVFAKEYIETRIKTWQEKDDYETVAEYRERVNELNRNAKVEEFKNLAREEYIRTYAQRVRLDDMSLKPYDAENRVFLIESKYGELVLPVPRENNKAKEFESLWNGMQLRNPEFNVSDDHIVLSSLTFITPTGDAYQYDGNSNLDYVETIVDVSFDPIDDVYFAQNEKSSKESRVKHQSVKVGNAMSDVDSNIPETGIVNERTFAVIIANENYSMVAPVPMALNDGNSFSKYCRSTLGLPESNVRLYKDASFGVMIRAMRDIKDIAEAFSGGINVIFYYAGHGIPNEATKDAFLLPIDADGMQTEGCYSLNRLYGELGGLNAESVVVFLDACFSGANRNGDMLASARGVALKPKVEAPKGNMVIFSAASGNETAFPYEEKGHGLFTYYLLKKLQETKGNVNLNDLGNYIIENVKQKSTVVNHKSQTPTVTFSTSFSDSWQSFKLNGK